MSEKVKLEIEVDETLVRRRAESGDIYERGSVNFAFDESARAWVTSQRKADRDKRFGIPWRCDAWRLFRSDGWVVHSSHPKCIASQKLVMAAPRMAELLERFVVIESDKEDVEPFGDVAAIAKSLLREIGWIDGGKP